MRIFLNIRMYIFASCSPQIVNFNKNARFQFVINEIVYFSLLKNINSAIMRLNSKKKRIPNY